jgi:hypothetical protein
MPTKSSQYRNAFKSSNTISKQFEDIVSRIEVRDLKEVHDLSDDDMDMLLNTIKTDEKPSKPLIDYVNDIIIHDNITNPTEIYKIKVKVLLDNLAKNMCRSSHNDEYKIELSDRQVIKDVDLVMDYHEPLPIIKPKVVSKKILRRYNPFV